MIRDEAEAAEMQALVSEMFMGGGGARKLRPSHTRTYPCGHTRTVPWGKSAPPICPTCRKRDAR